jgi:hypothetical protein
VARRIGGPRLALITAAIVALDPELWKWDSQVLSEPLYAPLTALVLLLAYRLSDRMTIGRAAVLGAGDRDRVLGRDLHQAARHRARERGRSSGGAEGNGGSATPAIT